MSLHVIDLSKNIERVKLRLQELDVSDPEVILSVYKKTVSIELEYVLEDATRRFLDNCECLSEMPVSVLNT